MSGEETAELRRVIHEELAGLRQAEKPPLVKYWPVALSIVAVIVWLVRIEGRLDAHQKSPWHDGMKDANERIVRIETKVDTLTLEVQALKKTLE